jgi:FKBP-type peptidyl-prolyl cis-trans isomerase
MKHFTILAAASIALAAAFSHAQDTTTTTGTAVTMDRQTTGTGDAAGGKKTLPNGTIVEEIQAGAGAEAVKGKTVRVHYTGTLTDGKKFDSSRDRSEPFAFRLGAGDVIKGWDEGVVGMKVGGKRKLTIPPEAGYGSRDLGIIPPNSTLLFDIELLAVE